MPAKFRCFFAVNATNRIPLLMAEGVKDILISYAYARKSQEYMDLIRAAIKKGAKIMVDSGGHSNIHNPGTVKLEDYVAWIKKNPDVAQEYIVLDHPMKREVTIKNLQTMRDAGLKPISVDHVWFPFKSSIQPWYTKGGVLCWAGFSVGNRTPMGDWAGLGKEKAKEEKDAVAKKMPKDYGREFSSRAEWLAIAKRVHERHGHALRAPVNQIHLLGIGSRIKRFLPFLEVVRSIDAAGVFIAAGYGRVHILREGRHPGEPPRICGARVGRGRKPPDDVAALARKWKLDLDSELDRRKFNIRETLKYHDAIWDYFVAEHKKGHEHLLEMSVKKNDEEDEQVEESPRLMVQVPLLIEAAWGERLRLDEVELVQSEARMHVSDVTPSRLSSLSDPSLALLHDEAHGLAGVELTGLDTAHLFIVQEMAKRALPHDPEPGVGLDLASKEAAVGLGLVDAELETLGLVRKQMVIQSLVLSKDKFKSVADAKTWIKDHGFHIGEKQASEALEVTKPDVDETETSFRFRQRPPTDFVPDSMRTITITDGVKAVVGELKPGVEKSEADEDPELLKPVMDAILLPVDKADEDRKIVLGVVLEPNSVDTQGDTISPDEIERAAHLWLARFQDRGFMHRQIVNSKIEIYESYLAPVDLTMGGQKVKKGTWLLMYHVTDDALWAAIKRGDLTGFSMGGFARRVKT